MKYVVNITVRYSDFESISTSIVDADSEEQAKSLAFEGEIRDAETAYFEDGAWWEGDESHAYRIYSVAQVSDADAEVLAKYLP